MENLRNFIVVIIEGEYFYICNNKYEIVTLNFIYDRDKLINLFDNIDLHKFFMCNLDYIRKLFKNYQIPLYNYSNFFYYYKNYYNQINFTNKVSILKSVTKIILTNSKSVSCQNKFCYDQMRELYLVTLSLINTYSDNQIDEDLLIKYLSQKYPHLIRKNGKILIKKILSDLNLTEMIRII